MPTQPNEQDPVDWFSPREADDQGLTYSDEEVSQEEWQEAQAFKSEEGADPPPPRGTSLNPKMIQMRELGRNSKIPRKIWLKLLASAELDDLRDKDNRIGMSLLYEAFCKHGNKLWIDPLEELKVIFENLEKFQGEIRHLRSFIFLLVQLARAHISPGAFLRYVLLPRMNFDYNYRNWREKNFWALEKIALGLIELRQKPPFNKPFLAGNRVLVENVLAKYVGKPLAKFRVSELEQDENLQQYFTLWTSLTFNSLFFLDFCRINIFPFMYRLSGKVDLVQWVYVMRLVVELEKAFDKGISKDSSLLRESVLGFSLYSSFEDNMMARQEKGQKPYDMVRELKAFLQSVIGLLKTNNGVYLISWLASQFHAAKDPDVAEGVARLIVLIKDDGGKKIYKEHILQYQRLNPSQREIFLDAVYQNQGSHPDINLLDHPLGSPESLFPIVLLNEQMASVSSTSLKQKWDRSIPGRRAINFSVLEVARQKIRLDIWQKVYSILEYGPQLPSELIPLLQNFILQYKNQTQPQIIQQVKKADYLARQIPFMSASETRIAALICSVFYGKFHQFEWSKLSGGVVLSLVDLDEFKFTREFLVADSSPDRPSLQHLREAVIFFLKLLEQFSLTWDQTVKYVRPKVGELFRHVVGINRPLPEFLSLGLKKLWSIDELNIDRARLWDALSTKENQTNQGLDAAHFEVSSHEWVTLILINANTPILKATWKKIEEGWVLIGLRGSGTLLFNWGQNDYLRAWVILRQVWENWVKTKAVKAFIPVGQWIWENLSELPQAINQLEQKLGLRGSLVNLGDSAKLSQILK